MLVNTIKDSTKIHSKVWLAIYLNFSTGEKHGCKKNCSFCQYQKNPIYMCPTKQDVIEFITTWGDKAKYHSILVSGGGDPLYNFEENKDKVLDILETISSYGFDIALQSYELDVIDKYFNTLFNKVNTYLFSAEYYDEKLAKLATKLLAHGKRVYIYKILNYTSTYEEIDFEKIDEWVTAYAHCSSTLVLHENYTCCLSISDDLKALDTIKNKYKDMNVFISFHRLSWGKHVVLINNEVVLPFEYFHTIFLDDLSKYYDEYNTGLFNHLTYKPKK